MGKLDGKVAIVTGSSRGIGKAIAIEFARQNANLVVIARSDVQGQLPGTINETAAEIRKCGTDVIAVKCDVTKEEDVENAVGESIRKFGRIDILVNNAAVGYYKKVMETPLKHWDLVQRVNLRGPFICIKSVLQHMIERRMGSIINISSSAAHDIYSRVDRGEEKRLTGCAYGSSKAALERLTVGLAEELKEYNIAVNALKPELPTYSEGVAFWNPDIDKADFVSPYTYMTKAAIFLAEQRGSTITGRVFFDRNLCEEHNLS